MTAQLSIPSTATVAQPATNDLGSQFCQVQGCRGSGTSNLGWGWHMADQSMDLRHVRDNLGHESLSTTSGYLHTADDARHRETEEKHRIGW